jgi:hypothetical protein
LWGYRGEEEKKKTMRSEAHKQKFPPTI